MTARLLHFWCHKLDPNDMGLAWCVTCGGAEGDLPEHCPQRPMTEEEREAVMDGRLDFRRSEGGWTTWTRARAMRVKGMVT